MKKATYKVVLEVAYPLGPGGRPPSPSQVEERLGELGVEAVTSRDDGPHVWHMVKVERVS